MPRPPTVLPIAYLFLRILIVLNWILGGCILGLLVYTFVNEPWTMKALGVTAYRDANLVMNGMRAIAALGVVGIFVNFGILTRLVSMVMTVRAGNPFVGENAYRLQAIAWFLLILQLFSLVIAGIAEAISTVEHPFRLDAGFSAAGWLAVVLTFVLARVFAEGALMREDLEGTV
ncbi:MAG: hypothetical protein AVDCRST_MAG93-2906 [uncultured Chloroflexia bacterium]|uniref:DUF2975 domain-containing protein n=1 Tax=uncultured Chloroflexia bacterium TaxID=1672391 RepID=A0A6J4JH51_9CHLR|nr:MAG: hypothetical protein AVDCRST_MAG93-2906 [uncultured Chloroflexia bacterium]